MKLSMNTAQAIREELNKHDLKTISGKYKERGLSYTRFIWDCWHSIGHAKTNDILKDNNPSLVFIGGYVQDVNDSHIETVLKKALGEFKY